jgi:hypothetical protein
VQDDLAGLPRLHQFERRFEIVDAEVMRDDRLDIEPALQHAGHLVPGLEHLPTVNTF